MSISPTNFGDFIALPEKQTQKQLNLPSAIRSHQIQAVRELFWCMFFAIVESHFSLPAQTRSLHLHEDGKLRAREMV